MVFDLLIIGGGINGAGLARDAALRGLKVFLVEKGDFASGTSSKSSKLIHGGLRYLEQGNFKLVYQSCHERAVLLKMAPHLVHPLQFIIPVYKGDPRSLFKIKLGMFLYDGLASFKNIRRHKMLTPAGVIDMEPGLSKDGLVGGALYYDAQTDDARLCLENILSARAHGAVCMNYVEAIGLLKEKSRICGALLKNHNNGEEWTVQAKVVVNATGPWADNVLELSQPGHKKMLRLTKGIHIITRSLTKGEGILFSSRSDGRVLFVLPWKENSLIGSTDTDYNGDPADASATREDVDYLLKEVNRLLPDAKLRFEDVITTFAGVRPLLNDSGMPASNLSREHLIHEDENGLVSILGGKYTTYRLVAEQAMSEIIKKPGIHPGGPCMTKVTPL